MKKSVLFAICILTGLLGLANANLITPEWAGSENTVHAVWDSWQDFGYDVSMLPDEWQANGLSESADAMAHDNAQYIDVLNGRNGIIELNGDWQLDFWVPNFSNNNPQKILWVQVTYLPFEDVRPDIWVDAVADAIYGPYGMQNYAHTDGWVTATYEIVIEPNPVDELVSINFAGTDAYPMYVDAVTIDTICIPEPATLAVLALGAGLIVRKKRA